MTFALRLILADQLSEEISLLQGLDPVRDSVLMCEVMEDSSF
ncbi:MAG: hypothetical protein ACOYNL_05890 [Rickettsiales bacterium]